ncbi:MAG: hypothetical protein AAFX50_05565 [Acidobacteriota bacterium]
MYRKLVPTRRRPRSTAAVAALAIAAALAVAAPARARVLEVHYESLRYEVLVESPHPWTAEWAQPASPGPRAEAEAGPLLKAPGEDGLLTADVPADRRRNATVFGRTPAGQLGAWISILSTVALAATAFGARPLGGSRRR